MKKENEKTWIERWDELESRIYYIKGPFRKQRKFALVRREAEQGNIYARLELSDLYLDRGEKEKAVENLKQCVQDGIDWALILLAEIYYHEKDYAQAREYYEKALKSVKTYESRTESETGREWEWNRRREYKEALDLYRRGCRYISYVVEKLEYQLQEEREHNDVSDCADELGKYKKLYRHACRKIDELCLEIARRYETGDGVKQDYNQAIWWYKEAEGNIDAIERLGELYECGLGTIQDMAEAADWYVKAALWWQSEAAEERPENLEERKENSFRAYAKALECYREDYETVKPDNIWKWIDCAHLWYMYENGLGVQQDSDRAQEYYERIFECKDQADVFLKIGIGFKNGEGFSKNIDVAEGWLLKAVQLGSTFAMFQLALLYHYEKDDLDTAIQWYEKAAELDLLDAILKLAAIYEDNDRLHDEQKAIKWYEKAVSLGSWKGMCQLAEMYRKGEGVSKDIKKAKQLYRQVMKQAEQGERSSYARMSEYENSIYWEGVAETALREMRPFGR